MNFNCYWNLIHLATYSDKHESNFESNDTTEIQLQEVSPNKFIAPFICADVICDIFVVCECDHSIKASILWNDISHPLTKVKTYHFSHFYIVKFRVNWMFSKDNTSRNRFFVIEKRLFQKCILIRSLFRTLQPVVSTGMIQSIASMEHHHHHLLTHPPQTFVSYQMWNYERRSRLLKLSDSSPSPPPANCDMTHLLNDQPFAKFQQLCPYQDASKIPCHPHMVINHYHAWTCKIETLKKLKTLKYWLNHTMVASIPASWILFQLQYRKLPTPTEDECWIPFPWACGADFETTIECEWLNDNVGMINAHPIQCVYWKDIPLQSQKISRPVYSVRHFVFDVPAKTNRIVHELHELGKANEIWLVTDLEIKTVDLGMNNFHNIKSGFHCKYLSGIEEKSTPSFFVDEKNKSNVYRVVFQPQMMQVWPYPANYYSLTIPELLHYASKFKIDKDDSFFSSSEINFNRVDFVELTIDLNESRTSISSETRRIDLYIEGWFL